MRKAMMMTIMVLVVLCSGCGKDKDVYTPGEPDRQENGVSVYIEEDFVLYDFESQDVLNK